MLSMFEVWIRVSSASWSFQASTNTLLRSSGKAHWGTWHLISDIQLADVQALMVSSAGLFEFELTASFSNSYWRVVVGAVAGICR